MDFVVAGISASCAGFFTNPLEVIKTRMQMQGELQKRGTHKVHYRNIAHASYQIVKHDGILSLQAGLAPAILVQFFMNGSRLGGFQLADNHNLLRDEKGKLILMNCMLAAGFSGVFGHYISNPLHIVRTHKQLLAAKAIAVGTQHEKLSIFQALIVILRRDGIKGFFRGGIAIFPRAFVASSSQLLSFTYSKQYLNQHEYFQKHSLVTSFCASMVGGVAISILTNPFDLVLMRLYNQGVSANGKGVLYSGYFDCIKKVYQIEGIRAFYKGIGPMYLRLGPHSVLTLVFWDISKNTYAKFSHSINKMT